MSYSVNISVEAPIENQIQEITYDGTEIYQPPLTLSESLAKFAQKIDFSKTSDVDIKKESGEVIEDNKSDSDSKDAFQSSLWPWDSARNKLRNAFQEVCVLADVLAIAKDKRYMVLDPVQQEPIETKPMVQIYARKKALAGAASVLLTGAERLKTSQNEAARNRAVPDFHIELLRLRQNWRLKKVSNTIIGDLSYRTAGSKYTQTGTFEVTKAEDDDKTNSPPSSPVPGGPTPTKNNSALRVLIPSELQGVAYIEVLCQKDQEDLCSANINLLGSGPPASNPDMHWQQKLEAAQNVLFCKELFNQLAKEAVQLQAPIPHMVVGNQIMATVFPGIQLIIGLCHSTTGDKKPPNPSPSKTDHDHSCVKINISTHGYDALCRTPLVIHVGEKSLKCICRDGKVMYMSYEPQELRDLIFCHINQHQILAVQALAKTMGWQFLANSNHLGTGAVEPLGNASSCLLASPTGDRIIAVRCEPQTGIQVSVAHSPRSDFFPSRLVTERKWEHLGGQFRDVRLEKMEGRNFLHKMELLMASLTSSS
ncbi:mediator of RNA polymerase II transcription subunit 17 [Asbolus verrucosus]|uniref:Mediator of RNA polymerase II transcription subunit 17 n=1 Tax=Asbolus verrucosus TaxID=1661398 RepID=A0A482VQQ4_ASBVE|nr:mediator of RNA polymerase II transcription subunit 17 [Asbolus verrucosus]